IGLTPPHHYIAVNRAHRAIANNTNLGIKSIGNAAFRLRDFWYNSHPVRVNTLANSNKPIYTAHQSSNLYK
ncbi:MAG: hypothetical protein O4805_06565, partial [Trichodesmium sp. St16_bin2-tuft]|nr:hypothetical protein [Trichodesmium sp. St16_bin2-tuft]